MHIGIFIFTIFWFLLGLRTTLFWLQSWQIREYRWDRMKAHLRTKDGTKNLFSLWFFPGVLPRPKLSGRLMLIGMLFLTLSFGFYYVLGGKIGMIFTVLLWERVIFLLVSLSIFISGIPVLIKKKNLFRRAKGIIDGASGVTVIGITGSFGKSSTKEILVHLLKSKFGEENVLFTPENQNNEVAIARLVLKKWEFFCEGSATNLSQSPIGNGRGKNLKKVGEGKQQRFFVVEVGAYARGEIQTVCKFVQPQIAILTGVNAQHLELFGSQQNVQKAKFELAEGTSEKVFFNTESSLLAEIFGDQEIKAVPIPLSTDMTEDVQDEIDKTSFIIYGEKMVLPWPGKFYVMNALLAMETVREIGMSPKEIATSLPSLPSLKRALTMEKRKNGVVVLKDIYSANPTGVLAAVAHLEKFPGQKVFVSIPLLELGENAEKIHRQIFNELSRIGAEIFWWKSDFQDIGIETCGARFHGKDLEELQKIYDELNEGDVVLLESRLPKKVVMIFDKN